MTNTPENSSGMGEQTIVPYEIKKSFNWGAFLATWIWGIGNRTYITLISLVASFIPIIGTVANLFFAVWFGIKGNEWAWRNKRFLSIEHFQKYQRMWVVIGLILMIVSSVITATIAATLISSIMSIKI